MCNNSMLTPESLAYRDIMREIASVVSKYHAVVIIFPKIWRPEFVQITTSSLNSTCLNYESKAVTARTSKILAMMELMHFADSLWSPVHQGNSRLYEEISVFVHCGRVIGRCS